MMHEFRWLAQSVDGLQWLDKLKREQPSLSDEQLKNLGDAALAIAAEHRAEAPLYLRALSGIGAIISSLLILYLLYLFDLFRDDALGLCLNGAGLMAIAKLFHRSGLKRVGLAQDFFLQIALTLLQAGKFALVYGLVDTMAPLIIDDWVWTAVGCIGVVGAISYWLFPSGLERFLSVSVFLLSIWLALMIDGPTGLETTTFSFLILLHLLVVALFTWAGSWQLRLPAIYDALLISLCFGVGLVATLLDWSAMMFLDGTMGSVSSGFGLFGYAWPTQILMMAALLLLILWAGRGRWLRTGSSVRPNEALIMACVGVVLLGLVSDPGILLAVGLLVLGYATHRPAYVVLGLLFSLGFGVRYYYALEITLLEKSAILVASGLLMLAGAGYIYWRGWSKPTVSPETEIQSKGAANV